MKPVKNSPWTKARCRQFSKLELLLNEVVVFDRATGVSARIKRMTKIAELLTKEDFKASESSFMRFLREQIIKSRFPVERQFPKP